MKYGVISDVHGNIVALNAVLNEFERQNVEKIICCGDIIGIGPEPEKAVQRLIQIKEKLICVRGNHEGYLLEGIPEIIHDRAMTKGETAFHRWTQSVLSDSTKQFLSNLPYEIYIEEEGKKIYVTHYAYEENKDFKRHIFLPNAEECAELFSNIDADIYLFGHTHNKVENNTNGKKYINPGSLGCPCDSKKADCGILEINQNEVKYEQLEVPYDVRSVINEIKEIKFPCYKMMLQDFFGEKGDILQ